MKGTLRYVNQQKDRRRNNETRIGVNVCCIHLIFRMYGALTGLSKTETAKQLGSELVQEWRGSLRTRPPPMEKTSQYWPGKDRKYADLTSDQIPATESLMDCMERTEPLWEERILYELKMGRNVLVVAHANTLRGLVKLIDNIGDDEIQGKFFDFIQFWGVVVQWKQRHGV